MTTDMDATVVAVYGDVDKAYRVIEVPTGYQVQVTSDGAAASSGPRFFRWINVGYPRADRASIVRAAKFFCGDEVQS